MNYRDRVITSRFNTVWHQQVVAADRLLSEGKGQLGQALLEMVSHCQRSERELSGQSVKTKWSIGGQPRVAA